jgi:hypothetical protein
MKIGRPIPGKSIGVWVSGGLYSRIAKLRNECWENVFEEKQACSSESEGWGSDNRNCIAPLIGTSWELSQAELSLNGYRGATGPCLSGFRR